MLSPCEQGSSRALCGRQLAQKEEETQREASRAASASPALPPPSVHAQLTARKHGARGTLDAEHGGIGAHLGPRLLWFPCLPCRLHHCRSSPLSRFQCSSRRCSNGPGSCPFGLPKPQTLSLPVALSQPAPASPCAYCPSRSLARSLTHSLTHSLTRSLAHSLPLCPSLSSPRPPQPLHFPPLLCPPFPFLPPSLPPSLFLSLSVALCAMLFQTLFQTDSPSTHLMRMRALGRGERKEDTRANQASFWSDARP
jgi:hypothetical protein